MKYRLIGSASTLEQIVKLIEAKWCWLIAGTPEISKGVYAIHLNHKVSESRIVLKKGRYRFEIPTKEGK